MLTFEWDEKKNQINQKKHKVSFQEAQTVFFDPYARIIDDWNHSETEERFLILGYSKTARLLMVCHCYCDTEEHIRIISARKANKEEERQYHDLM